MSKKFLILIFATSLISLVVSMQSGLNYYDSFQEYLNITSPNKTYQFAFMLANQGDTMRNNPAIADIDNDGTNELIIPAYSGKIMVWNWSGMKTGIRETIDGTDRGTYYPSNAEKMLETEVDNDGDGYLEMVINDYTGYMRVLEYDGASFSQVFAEPSDAGEYRNSPVFCDIDSDGDYDIFASAYNGTSKLYIYNSSGMYSRNYTHSISGATFDIDGSPTCADYDNDGDRDIGVFTFNGYFAVYNWSNNALSYINSYGDYGSSYSSPKVGNFLGDGLNYTIVCAAEGTCVALNCTGNLNACSALDTSNDIGYIYYGGSEFHKVNINNKDVLLGADLDGNLILVELEDSSTLTITAKAMELPGQIVNRIGLASNGTMGYSHILRNDHYKMGVSSETYSGTKTWQTTKFSDSLPFRFHSGDSFYSFYSNNGWACGQLDSTTTEDECVIVSYLGTPYVYTLQNITEYRFENFYSEYELSLLDIMPRDATQYLIGNRTYCVNENRNILRDSLGGGDITAWINTYDDEGSAISNFLRITDGIKSTSSEYESQGTIDYTNYDSGTSQWMELNFSKPVQLGQINWVGVFGGYYDPQNLIIQISDTNCVSSNFTTIYNESNSDISGAATYDGLKIRFLPQIVQCIRITSSGVSYSQTTLNTANIITELEGYYANNCTFYSVPLDFLGADIGGNYNFSIKTYPNKYRDSPNQMDNDYESFVQNSTSNSMEVIDRLIIWVDRYL